MDFIVLIFGIIIGSFLNVCIYRIPNKKSIVYPSSFCPICGTPLKPLDLVPLLSYLLNSGKCKYCKVKISIQYPLIELLNGIIYILLFMKYGLSILFFKYAVLSSLIIVIAVIDLKTKEIPDELNAFGLLSGLLFSLLHNTKFSLIDGSLGLLLGSAIFLLIAIASGGAMGGGDIKMIGMLGFAVGWKNILLLMLLSFVIGAVISVVLMLLRIKSRKDYIPFGPFIALAYLITILYRNQIINWYIQTLIS